MTDDGIKSFIKLKRTEKAITKTAMAAMLGIDRNTYHNIEEGKTRILNVHIARISEILGLDVVDLVNGYTGAEYPERQEMTDIIGKYESRLRDEKNQHEDEIAALKSRITHLEEILEMQRRQLRDKEDIINLLKSRKNQ